MRIAVTGASGFLGRRLVSRLIGAGRNVNVLGRSPKTGLPPEARFFLWDPNKAPPTAASLEGCQAVLHLAGEPVAQRWTPEVKRRIRDSRVEGTRRMVEGMASLDRKPSTLIAASAVGFYGDCGDEILDESSPAGKGFLPETCLEWENASRLAQSLGVRVVLLRIGVVLDQRGGALARMLPIFRLGLGGRLGSGQQWMPWVHLGDLLDLIEFAIVKSSLKGPVNACSPNPVTNSDFTLALGRALHRPALLPVPRTALRLLYGEMSDILFDSQRVIPKAAQQGGFEFGHPELFAALKDVVAS